MILPIKVTKKERRNEMIDTKRLERAIVDSGLHRGYLAKKLGISRTWFHKKCSGEVDFTTREAQILCGLLGISGSERENIFFSENATV